MDTQTALFGGGCFWCTEAVFQRLKGVVSVVPGYTGGTLPNPRYEDITKGNSGHAEVSKIEFNPEQIKFEDLLNVFFATHDPTTLNRQGADTGTQYRSAIFYTSGEQKDQAEKFIKILEQERIFNKPIVTEIRPLEKFYEAEEYHKNYYNQNANSNPYCTMVINPKLQKLKEKFYELMK